MLYKKIFLYFLFFTITYFNSNQCNAEIKESFVDGSVPFVLIEDINRQSEAWATCSAAYNVMSELYEHDSARSKQMKELGNGAAVAVTMSIIANDFEENISPSKLNALWSYAKMAGSEWPKSHATTIAADAERTGQGNPGKFFDKLKNTIEICINNLDGQQSYIDMWREMAKSGLLQLPNE